MGTLGEAAKEYVPKKMKNVADLEVVELSILLIEDEVRQNAEGNDYVVSYFVKDGEEYRVPPTVLEQIKGILKEKPETKTVKVNKTGEGFGTKYQVISLD